MCIRFSDFLQHPSKLLLNNRGAEFRMTRCHAIYLSSVMTHDYREYGI